MAEIKNAWIDTMPGNKFFLRDSKRFLEYHMSDEGIDFTLYDTDKSEIDGGCIEEPSFKNENELLKEITEWLNHIKPEVNLSSENLIQIDDIENYNIKLGTVKEIMKFIEELTSKGDYQCFETALLISDRSDLQHNEINESLMEQVQKLSEDYDSLFNEDLNYDLEDVFTKYKNKLVDIEDVKREFIVSVEKYMQSDGKDFDAQENMEATAAIIAQQMPEYIGKPIGILYNDLIGVGEVKNKSDSKSVEKECDYELDNEEREI